VTIFRIPIDITWNYGHGSPGANVWHGRTDGDPADSGIEDQLTWIKDFYTSILNLYRPAVKIAFNGEAQGVGSDTGTILTGTPWTLTGTAGAADAAPVLAVLCQWRAATGGRSGRGRTFLGPLGSGVAEADGSVYSGSQTAVQNAMNALIDASDSAINGALGIFSRTDGVMRDFVSGTVSPDFAVMRSRRD
jgi:hypothetical protein